MVRRIKAKAVKRKMVNIKGSLPVTILKENNLFVAYTPALDLSTCGRTFEEAQANFKEAVDIFFDECIKRKTLDDALLSLGWTKISRPTKAWSPPKVVGQIQIPIDRPIPVPA